MMVQCAAQASALRAGGPGHNARGHRRSGRGTNITVDEKSSSAPGVASSFEREVAAWRQRRGEDMLQCFKAPTEIMMQPPITIKVGRKY